MDTDRPSERPTAFVDVTDPDLVPPEPMTMILDALVALPPGGRLMVSHVRRPIHLYPRLDALGCTHQTRDLGPDRIELLIDKPAGDPA